MKVLVSPGSFKGSLTPCEAARAIAAGLGDAFPEAELDQRPLADGGEGTLAVLLDALGGEAQTVPVEDPLGRGTDAGYGLAQDGNLALIESAQANGLMLLQRDERDPTRASTTGVGQLIRAALDRGVRAIWVALGGSATVDGGAGMLRALGARLLDSKGREIPNGGRGLSKLASMDLSGLDTRVNGVEITALCDVKSPLLGPQGARLYMPQKGATPEQCEELAQGLARLAEVAERDAGIDLREIPGAGAAGGLGAALALLGAELVSGSDFVIEQLELEEHVRACDLVVSGEGRVDEQTAEGKALSALARLARRHGRPLVVLCGSRAADLTSLYRAGVTAVFSIVPGPIPLEEALRHPERYARETARQLGTLLRALASRG